MHFKGAFNCVFGLIALFRFNSYLIEFQMFVHIVTLHWMCNQWITCKKHPELFYTCLLCLKSCGSLQCLFLNISVTNLVPVANYVEMANATLLCCYVSWGFFISDCNAFHKNYVWEVLAFYWSIVLFCCMLWYALKKLHKSFCRICYVHRNGKACVRSDL
jgi:hypothetical protein